MDACRDYFRNVRRIKKNKLVPPQPPTLAKEVILAQLEQINTEIKSSADDALKRSKLRDTFLQRRIILTQQRPGGRTGGAAVEIHELLRAMSELLRIDFVRIITGPLIGLHYLTIVL